MFAPTGAHSDFLSIDNRRVRLWRAGERGPAVLLLHGGGLDSASLSWGDLIPNLAQDFRVYAPDWPGYGESQPLEGPFTTTFAVEFTEQLLDALGLPSASLAGISMGGGAALGFALDCPERVEKLVLVDSYGLQAKAPAQFFSALYVRLPLVDRLTWALTRSRSMVRRSLGMIIRDKSAITDELVDEVMAEATRPNAGKAFATYQKEEIGWKGTKTCFMDRLGEVRAPTLIMHGTHDSLVPPALAEEAHRRIPGSRLHWMQGCGHWPQRERPEEFNRVVKEFLAYSSAKDNDL